MSSSSLESLVLSLHDIQAINLNGPYTLKSGLTSPIYIDLRVIISDPKVLQSVSDHMYEVLASRFHLFQRVCGVAYTALPIATILSLQRNLPMVMRRKEVKEYGLKKSIEGLFNQDDNCLIIEDLVTSGTSVFETVQPITQAGMKVTDVVVLINREQGGAENLTNAGLHLHSVLTISQVLDILENKGRITKAVADEVRHFIKANQVTIKAPQQTPAVAHTPVIQPPSKSLAVSVHPPTPIHHLTYGERAAVAKNVAAAKLFNIMQSKQTNLCLSADVTTKKELLTLAEVCGPNICMLKTHVDILVDFDMSVIETLRAIAERHNFLLFEDRKFADIGSTVLHQYSGGIYRTVEWSHITNAHLIPGPGIIKGLLSAVEDDKRSESDRTRFKQEGRGLLLIAEMSSEGNLATGDYTNENVKIAEKHDDFVIGFICQHKLSYHPGLLHMSPGVQLPPSSSSSSTGKVGGDNLGQQYHTPSLVIGKHGSDVIIVGRAIIQAVHDQQKLADITQQYQQAGWRAYEEARQQK